MTNWIIFAVYAFGSVLGYKAVKREYLKNHNNHVTPGLAIGIGLFWPATLAVLIFILLAGGWAWVIEALEDKWATERNGKDQ